MTVTVQHSELHELVQLVLQGAEANERPDVVRRMRAATGAGAPVAIVRALRSLEVDLRSRRATLGEPGRAARLAAESRHAGRRRRDFEERAAKWPRLVGDALSAMGSDVEYAVEMRLRSVLDEGTALVESRGELDGWLHERLASEADAVRRLLRSAAGAAVERIAGALEVSVAAPSVTLSLDTPSTPHRRPTGADRQPLATRLLGVIMPTYSGMMVALVLPRLFGLRLPLWLVLTVAVAGATAMGGAAVAGERQRQVSRRTAETIGDLRSKLDAVRMAWNKQVRDAVRAVDQQLHAAVGEAVTERTRRLSAAAAAARDVADDSGRTEQALRDIDADLESVHALQLRALQLVESGPYNSWSRCSQERTTVAAS